MPKYVTTNKPSVHRFSFEVDGELVTPTSASYTLRKNDNLVVNGIEDEALSIASGQVAVAITIPNTANVMTLPYEVRYLEVKFEYSSNIYTIVEYYILRDNILFPLSVSDVEALVGTSLPTGLVDILAAYDEVTSDSGIDTDTILSTGAATLPSLIEAVKCKAALKATAGLQNSMMQMEQADNTLYKRFASIDFKALDDKLTAQYSLAINKLQGLTSDTITSPIFAVVASGTDPVTGA